MALLANMSVAIIWKGACDHGVCESSTPDDDDDDDDGDENDVGDDEHCRYLRTHTHQRILICTHNHIN
jgi:hypothetical protein